jgi:hypothetical protein
MTPDELLYRHRRLARDALNDNSGEQPVPAILRDFRQVLYEKGRIMMLLCDLATELGREISRLNCRAAGADERAP